MKTPLASVRDARITHKYCPTSDEFELRTPVIQHNNAKNRYTSIVARVYLLQQTVYFPQKMELTAPSQACLTLATDE